MPATLTSITNKRATVEVPLDKDDPEAGAVKVTYRPKWFNKLVQSDINRLSAEREGLQTVAADMVITTILHVVTDWDLRATEGDSEPIPLTPEGLELVPTEFLAEIVLKITEDQSPDPTKRPSKSS